jgi:hypothetical protein
MAFIQCKNSTTKNKVGDEASKEKYTDVSIILTKK